MGCVDCEITVDCRNFGEIFPLVVLPRCYLKNLPVHWEDLSTSRFLRAGPLQEAADTGPSAEGCSWPPARLAAAAALAAAVACATAWSNRVATRSAPVFASASRSSASSVFNVQKPPMIVAFGSLRRNRRTR